MPESQAASDSPNDARKTSGRKVDDGNVGIKVDVSASRRRAGADRTKRADFGDRTRGTSLAGDAVLIAPVSTRFPCYQGI
jgi:hypothetical protein